MGWDGAVLRAEIGAEFETLSFRREDVQLALAIRAEYQALAARERTRRNQALKKLELGPDGWRAYKRQACALYRARRRADRARHRKWCERMRPRWREAARLVRLKAERSGAT
jgi:hypothetical protein